eukprot:UC4_evm4s1532
MAGLVDYGGTSSSSEDEEDTISVSPKTITNSSNTPTSHLSSSTSSSPAPGVSGGGLSALLAKLPSSSSSTAVVRSSQMQHPRSLGRIASKRKALLGIPEDIPDSDSEEEDDSNTFNTCSIARNSTLTSSSSEPPLKRPRDSAVESEDSSNSDPDGCNNPESAAKSRNNMPLDRHMLSKPSRGGSGAYAPRALIPHSVKVRKEKSKEEKEAAGTNEFIPSMISRISTLSQDNYTTTNTDHTGVEPLSESSPTCPGLSETGLSPRPSGSSPSISVNIAPEPLISGTRVKYGYGQSGGPTANGVHASSAYSYARGGQQQQQQSYYHEQANTQFCQRDDQHDGRNARKMLVGNDPELARFLGRDARTSDFRNHQYNDPDAFVNLQRKTVAPQSRVSKAKHQLTWLASEAKANDQILQAKWASGRRAQMAARSRYGFR